MAADRSVPRIARSLLPLCCGIRFLIVALVLLFLGGPASAQQRALPPDLQARVNKAIDDGVNYLKLNQNPWGTWTLNKDEHPMGYAALGGLTLLVCGVPADDPVIVKAAKFVRAGVPACDRTYELALGILFLDKLGEVERAQGLVSKAKNSESRKDLERIEMLAMRLIAGQSPTGGWTYKCPVLTSKQQERLKTALRSKKEMKPAALGDMRDLPVLQRPNRLPQVEQSQDRHKPIWGQTDNSNSQFAMLAIWAARRHGVPVDRTLKLVVRRYESSQNKDGSWSYDFKLGGINANADSAAMNCVGLLGLAIGNGMAQDATLKDAPAAMKAAAIVGQPGLAVLLVSLDRVRQQIALKDAAKKAENDKRVLDGFLALDHFVGEPAGKWENLPAANLYLMFSIERVAVLYNLALLGKKDWYRWGAEILVATQQRDGNWAAKLYYGSTPPIDTCFALLFLKRANLASDLSATLASNTEGLAKDIEAKQARGVEKKETPPPSPQTPVVATPPPAPATDVAQPAAVARPRSASPKEDFSPPPEKGSNTLLYVLLGTLMLLLIAGAVAAYVLTRPREDDDDDDEDETPARKTSKANGKTSRSGVRMRSHKK
jgi:hypothetical protein